MSTMTEIDPASLLIGVVAHNSRLERARALAEQTQAQILNIDNTNTGDRGLKLIACANNHLEVLRQLQTLVVPNPGLHSIFGQRWCIILEDDALPVNAFRVHAAAALRYAPSQLVGFYIGRLGNVTALELAQSVDKAWVMTDHMVSAVAYAIRSDVLDHLILQYPQHDPAASPEVRVTDWTRRNNLRFSYTVPCLVDHSDGKSLIFMENNTREMRQLRQAWKVGTAPDWNTGVLQY